MENVFKKNKTGLHDNAMKGGGLSLLRCIQNLSSEEYKIIGKLKPLHTYDSDIHRI